MNQTTSESFNLFELVTYVSLNIFGFISGTFGNLLIIGAIILTKKLQNQTGLIIFNLALSDLLISSLSNPLAILGVLYGEAFYDHIPILCKICAVVCRMTCATAFVNIVILAIIRYIYICYKNIYNRYISIKFTVYVCLISWIIGFFADFPNQLVENGHHFDRLVKMCIFDHKIIRPATYFFSISLMLLPCFCICYLYTNIFVLTLNAKMNLNDKKKLKHLRKSLKISKGLFMSIVIFTMCVLPYSILMMTDFEGKYPPLLHMFLFLLARLNSSLNPILYGLTNLNFKRGFKNVFNKILCRVSIRNVENNKQTAQKA